MKINCAISAIRYAMPTYAVCNDTLQGIHPILSLPLASLYKLAEHSEALAPDEFKLLWLALLVRNPLVVTREATPLNLLSLAICEQSLPLLLQASQAPAARLSAKVMPMLALCPDTIRENGLANWLEFLEEALRYGAIISRDADAQDASYMRASNAATARSGKAFKLIATWAIDQMLIRCQSFADNGLRTLTQILFDNRPSNLDFMQNLKGQLLDHLPEKSIEDSFRKRTVLERMDSCIADGLLVAQALGLKSNEYITEQASAIASTYTIDGILNSAASPAAMLTSLLDTSRPDARSASLGLGNMASQPLKTYSQSQIAANPLLAKLQALGKL